MNKTAGQYGILPITAVGSLFLPDYGEGAIAHLIRVLEERL